MAVTLESTTRRYTGLSTDEKPVTTEDGKYVSAGSSFLELDTGRVFRADGGGQWFSYIPADEQAQLLSAILEQLTALREDLKLSLG